MSAVALHLEGDGDRARGSVDVVYTLATRDDERERAEYDYLINATGLKLNFAATPGRSRPSEGARAEGRGGPALLRDPRWR